MELKYVNCDLCGKDEYIVVGKKGRFNERVTNVICKDCELVYINPRMTEKETENYYRDLIKITRCLNNEKG